MLRVYFIGIKLFIYKEKLIELSIFIICFLFKDRSYGKRNRFYVKGFF